MKLKILIVAALVVVFLMPLTVLADGSANKPDELMLKVEVMDLSRGGELNEELSAQYELTSILGIEQAIKYHTEKVIETRGYTVAIDALNRPWIDYEDLNVKIYAYPNSKTVQVIHCLADCTGEVETRLVEWVELPYLMKLTDEDALKIANSRVQKMSGQGYELAKVKVEDVPDLPLGFTVLNEDGEEVKLLDIPTIHLLYVNSKCSNEENLPEPSPTEQRVDNATVESQKSLPATGDRSVTAFLLSSFLLGLGIYFLKRR